MTRVPATNMQKGDAGIEFIGLYLQTQWMFVFVKVLLDPTQGAMVQQRKDINVIVVHRFRGFLDLAEVAVESIYSI